MSRSSTILREHVGSLAKLILLFKHSVKLRRCILWVDVAACREMACVLFVVQTYQFLQQTAHTIFHDMLPQLHTIYNVVILMNALTEV
jgi:hypothetical protein